MSALGQKQTFAPRKGMSALPPKADMCGATGDVRFGPIADIAGFATICPHRERSGIARNDSELAACAWLLLPFFIHRIHTSSVSLSQRRIEGLAQFAQFPQCLVEITSPTSVISPGIRSEILTQCKPPR